ncbi:MAG: hypothetical protein EOP49_25800 [Sphingobacteriales bacterium]|nr:MAG: hypothetical protein EOP49_25800 [Sphingobacteriales bacterium]
MKHTNKTRFLTGAAFILFGVVLFQACKKEGEDNVLGAKPTPDFEVVQGTDANNLILVNKSSMPIIPYWSVSTGAKMTGDSAKINFVLKGTYQITLTGAGQGGLGSVTKTITIAQNDPTACSPTKPLGFIASCTSKKWKLNPAASAYKVGPGVDDGGWWSSGAGDVTARSCEFNDEYTFVFDGAGTFNYDNKGDFYADGSLGSNSNGCEPNANFTAGQKPWASGNFTYQVLPGGVKGLGQLKVVGLGAHIGLQKVRNGAEITTGAANSITYDILEMKQNGAGAGHDLLKLGVAIAAPGWWTFTLRSE